MDLEERIYGATTLIECSYKNMRTQGTGFYFSDLEEKDSNKGVDQYRQVLGIWIITNRHVALPKVNNKEVIPDVFIFNLRQMIKRQNRMVTDNFK